MDHEAVLTTIHQVLTHEGQAILDLAANLDRQASSFQAAVCALHERCGEQRPGRLIVTGVGKAGLIGRKIAATCASTGTPAQFLHPTEARHGDLGMVREDDVVLALSHSGRSEEVLDLLPSLRHIGVLLIALVGDDASALARHADIVIAIGHHLEACPLGLAPSTSTSVLLACGDALALAVQQMRGFTADQYARFHPAGALGRRLMTCAQVMRKDSRMATAAATDPIATVLHRITAARCGSALVIDHDGRLLGIFTDGDLRRTLAASPEPGVILSHPVSDHATMPCISIAGNDLLESALQRCARHRINEIPVVDDDGRAIGLIDVQDLADRGFSVHHGEAGS